MLSAYGTIMFCVILLQGEQTLGMKDMTATGNHALPCFIVQWAHANGTIWFVALLCCMYNLFPIIRCYKGQPGNLQWLFHIFQKLVNGFAFCFHSWYQLVTQWRELICNHVPNFTYSSCIIFAFGLWILIKQHDAILFSSQVASISGLNLGCCLLQKHLGSFLGNLFLILFLSTNGTNSHLRMLFKCTQAILLIVIATYQNHIRDETHVCNLKWLDRPFQMIHSKWGMDPRKYCASWQFARHFAILLVSILDQTALQCPIFVLMIM